MKHTQTGVFRPTANSIWRSLAATGRRHIFLTGQRGAGKSTLFRALAEKLSCDRVITCAEKERGVYLQTPEGETLTIGRYDASLPGTENKMRPVEEGFRKAAQRLEKLSQPWLALDEIGYLETAEYQKTLLRVLEGKQVLAVVRKQNTPFLTELLSRKDALVVDLDGCDIGCVIMASGLGVRFGGNKLMAALGGKPVAAWAMDGAKDVFSKTVTVTRHKDVKDLCEAKGICAILHDLPYRSDTVRLGVEQMQDRKGCLFLPGDQPFVLRESLYAMVLCAQNEPDAIWQLSGVSPMLFPQWAFEELKTLPEGKGGGTVAQKHPDKVRILPSQSPWEVRDIDTPQDLACFCAGICCC